MLEAQAVEDQAKSVEQDAQMHYVEQELAKEQQKRFQKKYDAGVVRMAKAVDDLKETKERRAEFVALCDFKLTESRRKLKMAQKKLEELDPAEGRQTRMKKLCDDVDHPEKHVKKICPNFSQKKLA